MSKNPSSEVPAPGQWPVDPQADVQVSKERIWIDGCFDFSHHGMHLDYYTLLNFRQKQLRLPNRTCWGNATSKATREGAFGGSAFRRGHHGQQRADCHGPERTVDAPLETVGNS